MKDFIELTLKASGFKLAIQKESITSFYEGQDGTYIFVSTDRYLVTECYEHIKTLLG